MLTPDAIKAARTSAGLTQRELAERLGVDTKTVNNWETGRTSPRDREPALLRLLDGHFSMHGEPGLSSATDAQLLAEIAKRFERRQESSRGNTAPTEAEGSSWAGVRPRS